MRRAAGQRCQRKEGDAPAPAAEHGADTFGLGGYLAKLKASTGVSGDMGKYAEAKLGVTTPPIPQLGGGALKIEGEGRYLTSKEGNELEISLHVGVTWGIDLKIFKADVQVFGEGKIKLKAKDGVLKKSYKISLEVEREGDKRWKDAKVDAKLFLGNSIGGEADAGKIGKVEASAAVGTFISITREVAEHLPGGAGAGAGH